MTGDDRNAHHVSGKILPDIRDGWSRSNVRTILTESTLIFAVLLDEFKPHRDESSPKIDRSRLLDAFQGESPIAIRTQSSAAVIRRQPDACQPVTAAKK